MSSEEVALLRIIGFLAGREQALAPEEVLDSPGAEPLQEAEPFVLPPVLRGHWTRSGSVRA